MPSYAPLPRIELDPRNEGQLVQAAAQRVYEASNATLNDFSSGSPIVALLEGQAFAQSEFLQFANEFPESVLVEWIGPFLGAQRRTGSGSVVDITFTIEPRDMQFDVFTGYRLSTDANRTNGETIQFVTTERLVIPAGQDTGTVRAVSVFKGVDANVAPGTITQSLTSLAGVVSVTNESAATGGMDAELMSEVKERFFSLIRRRNPVSSEDWVDFFSDALGPGTAVTVLPRRSERDTYRYSEDYVTTNPSVSFFVLNPDGSPISKPQQNALQTLIKWSLPTEFLGYIYPMEVNDADFTLDIQYDPSKPYAQNLTSLTEIIRTNLFGLMTPNAVFPVSYDPSVTDVEGALTNTFPATLGTNNQYIDPDIVNIKAYVPPKNVSISTFTQTSPQPFESGDAIKAGDLVIEQGNVFATYYQALQDFTPRVNDKTYYVNRGFLDVKIMQALIPGEYATGDVIVTETGDIHVVLTSFTYRSVQTINDLIMKGLISVPRIYRTWGEGVEITTQDADRNYDPDIVEYEADATRFTLHIPSLPLDQPPTRRPGAAVYVAARDFTVASNTTRLGIAQTSGLISSDAIIVKVLTDGETYPAGSFVKTPNPTELLAGDISRENCYIDQASGAQEIFVQVLNGFTFEIPKGGDFTSSFNTLIDESTVRIVDVVPFIDCKGQSTFDSKPFRYSARFHVGEYLRYRPLGGFDAAQLEECVAQNEACANVSEPCQKLLKQNLPLPRYFFVQRDFTPSSSDVQEMLDQGLITEVDKTFFSSNYIVALPSTSPTYSYRISQAMLQSGIIAAESELTPGETILVLNEAGESRGVFVWRNSQWLIQAPDLPTHREMFRFAPEDVATFRNLSDVRSYEATQHVTPMLDLEVYYDNGVFVRSDSTETVKWIDPTYRLEDVIYDLHNGAYSFYRANRSFTPPRRRTVWNEARVLSTPRVEELLGNTLKFVNEVSCAEVINSRLPDQASTSKLGVCQINLVSKSQGSASTTYVWERTDYSSQAAVLSQGPDTAFDYKPVNYGTGTLAL